ncbi:major facilitator superfamily transporter protein [Rutstroemia sp. NJR-2017a BBW]|nr:major facilitator superfamily transporter protein [Rutstroemia sp. NJR-2017a BBW]
MIFRHRSGLFFAIGALLILWVLLRDHEEIVNRVVEPFQRLDNNESADTPNDTHFDPPQAYSSSSFISPPLKIEAPKPHDVLYPPVPSPTPTTTLINPSSSLISKQPEESPATTSVTTQTAAPATIQTANTGVHTDDHEKPLKETHRSVWYSKAAPLEYNPYPEYNSEAWKAVNEGKYVACEGAEGSISNVLAFSGHSKAFADPHMGSYQLLGIDNSLCFERETRLGPYGHVEAITGLPDTSSSGENTKRLEDLQIPLKWERVNWGDLQDRCLKLNLGRYVASNGPQSTSEKIQIQTHNSSFPWNNSHNREPKKPRQFSSPVTNREETQAKDEDITLRKPDRNTSPIRKTKSRTAVIIRAYSGKKWNENDKQNIRSLITELSLGSGGEYQVFLFVHIKNRSNLIWEDYSNYYDAIQENVPKEFQDITVLWNDQSVQELYPSIPKKLINVHQSQWMPIQKFARDFPQFDHYWNWELDTRFTGHHYDLLEKIRRFAAAQPRKYLWERNERYYIPSIHGKYDTEFRDIVAKASGKNTVWGAPILANVTPTGPSPPTNPEQDNYEWGVNEDADYISVAPMFNPNGTSWVGKNDVWGYSGRNDTPRRATIITHSRVSKELLKVMHEENLKGNHVSSEMTPQKVALLHGLKAVYAPLPIFFDRAWNGTSLERWFNPGPRGQSGSTAESPFGWGKEKRFLGSTWYYRAIPPARLYNNWMGWEDHGIGGPEWEKVHGRPCLPPLLLHPIKNSDKVNPGHETKYDFP